MKITKISLPKRPKLFKRLNDPYRMVLINDQTLEEVASYQLTKKSVYVLASMLFVGIILITVSILLLTPLKYYVPGYGNNKTRMQVIKLKQTVDSLSDMIQAEQRQAADIRKVIVGDFEGLKDTTALNPDNVRRDEMNSILPKPEDIKKTAIQQVKSEKKKRK